VGCLHCQEVYDSYLIEWRIKEDADGKPHGFWCCPVAGCDGKGFGFDIFPVDPHYQDERGGGWVHVDEEAEEGEDGAGDLPGDSQKNGSQQRPDEESLPW
jgi:hypothetical protein